MKAPDVGRALAGAVPASVWFDGVDVPAPDTGALPARADLVVVGGGFTGLWTALLAKERRPDRDVVLLEADRVGTAASGRNGGFCSATLTHGRENGLRHFASEYDRLVQLGQDNLDAIEAAVARYRLDCEFERTGELSVAAEPYQVEELRAGDGEFLDRAAVRAELDSPTYLAGSWDRRGTAMVHPYRLAVGLAATARSLGVRIIENTRALDLRRGPSGVRLVTQRGTVDARQIALGTNAFRPLLRRLRHFTVPVYDYVLATEPLTDAQLGRLGWGHRQGVGDSANQFHYYRLTADNRILWGGYDAVYRFGGRVDPAHDQRPATFRLLAEHFFATFPQLPEVRFSHRWGGAIDTCTRFCAFQGTAFDGQVAYSLGYTGLGVGASRFGADVMLDLLAGEPTERTALSITRSRPLPFPPEPLAWAGITATRAALAAADRNAGRRNLWLRTLDRVGLGFDS